MSAAAFGYAEVEQCVTNFSLKMIGSSPDQLPRNLKEELEKWMAVSSSKKLARDKGKGGEALTNDAGCGR